MRDASPSLRSHLTEPDIALLLVAVDAADRWCELEAIQRDFERAYSDALAMTPGPLAYHAEAAAHAERDGELLGLAHQLGVYIGRARTEGLVVDAPVLRMALLECQRLERESDAALHRGEDYAHLLTERDAVWASARRDALRAA